MLLLHGSASFFCFIPSMSLQSKSVPDGDISQLSTPFVTHNKQNADSVRAQGLAPAATSVAPKIKWHIPSPKKQALVRQALNIPPSGTSRAVTSIFVPFTSDTVSLGQNLI